MRRHTLFLAILACLAGGRLHGESLTTEFARQYAVGDASVVRVDVALGCDDVDSATTIKAENRRIVALNVRVARGDTVTVSFLASVRHPQIIAADGSSVGTVALKPRERTSNSWDEALSLEFLGDAPRVREVSVVPVQPGEFTMVFLAGDSTVTDQAAEPYAGWGQALPLFFGPHACVANHAESGLTLASFRASRRLDKILSELRPGDFVLVQFGHNDQKDKREGAGAFTTYADELRRYVEAIRDRGGRPVLVTPVGRRRFDGEGHVSESLGDYPEAMRRVAAEKNVPLVDLNESSKRLYQALGVEGSRRVFVHGSFPGRTRRLEDNSHFSNYGAHQVARCVVESIRKSVPELAALLRPEVDGFDPSHPDAAEIVSIPASPITADDRPEGS